MTKTRTLIGGQEHGRVVEIPDHVKEFVVPVFDKNVLSMVGPSSGPQTQIYFTHHRYRERSYVYYGYEYGYQPFQQTFLVYEELSDAEAEGYLKDYVTQALQASFASGGIIGDAPDLGLAGTSTHPDMSKLMSKLRQIIPALTKAVEILCPTCNSVLPSVSGSVIHLNDTEGWSFEEIADWLDTLDMDLSVVEE